MATQTQGMAPGRSAVGASMMVAGQPHTCRFGRTPEDRCPTCLSRDCVHRMYNAKLIRFIAKHLEVYLAAYVQPGPASNQLERLGREYRGLPPRHDCTCRPAHCAECKRIDGQRPLYGDVAPSVGRTNRANSTTPDTTLLDLARAPAGMSAYDIARWLSGGNAIVCPGRHLAGP